MAVYRVIKDKDNPYIMINKYYIYDNRLSLKSKGIMSYFLSRPDDWEFYIQEIKKHTTDKDRSISGAIQELITCGYIKRTSKRRKDGKFDGGYDYEVYETPLEIINDESGACTENLPNSQNAESAKCQTGEMPNWQNDVLLNNESILNNECNYKEDLQDIINYYCSKALITEFQLKPVEIELITEILEDNIPMKIIKQGIDTAFENFKPSFKGNQIKTFKYCVPVIRNLQAKQKAKNAGGVKSGANKKNSGNELKEQGIGL